MVFYACFATVEKNDSNTYVVRDGVRRLRKTLSLHCVRNQSFQNRMRICFLSRQQTMENIFGNCIGPTWIKDLNSKYFTVEWMHEFTLVLECLHSMRLFLVHNLLESKNERRIVGKGGHLTEKQTIEFSANSSPFWFITINFETNSENRKSNALTSWTHIHTIPIQCTAKQDGEFTILDICTH